MEHSRKSMFQYTIYNISRVKVTTKNINYTIDLVNITVDRTK